MSRPTISLKREYEWESRSPFLLLPWATTRFVAEMIGWIVLALFALYAWNSALRYVPVFAMLGFFLTVPLQQSQVPVIAIFEDIYGAVVSFIDDIVYPAAEDVIYIIEPLCFGFNFGIDILATVYNIIFGTPFKLIMKLIFKGNPFDNVLSVPLVSSQFPLSQEIDTSGAPPWVVGPYDRRRRRRSDDDDTAAKQRSKQQQEEWYQRAVEEASPDPRFWVRDPNDPNIIYSHVLLSGIRTLDTDDPLLDPLIYWLAKRDRALGRSMPPHPKTGQTQAYLDIMAEDFDRWTDRRVPVHLRRAMTERFLRQAMDEATGLMETRYSMWDGFSFDAAGGQAGIRQTYDALGRPVSPWARVIGPYGNWRGVGVVQITGEPGGDDPVNEDDDAGFSQRIRGVDVRMRLLFDGKAPRALNFAIFEAAATFFFDVLDAFINVLKQFLDIMIDVFLTIFSALVTFFTSVGAFFAFVLNLLFKDFLGIDCLEFGGFEEFAISVVDCICGPIENIINQIFGTTLNRWFNYTKPGSLSGLPQAFLGCVGLGCIEIALLTSKPLSFATEFLGECMDLPNRVVCCIVSPWGCIVNILKQLTDCPCGNNWETIDPAVDDCAWEGQNSATEAVRCIIMWFITNVMINFVPGGAGCDIDSCIDDSGVADAFFRCLWNGILGSANFLNELVDKIIKRILKKVKKKFGLRDDILRRKANEEAGDGLEESLSRDEALDDVVSAMGATMRQLVQRIERQQDELQELRRLSIAQQPPPPPPPPPPTITTTSTTNGTSNYTTTTATTTSPPPPPTDDRPARLDNGEEEEEDDEHHPTAFTAILPATTTATDRLMERWRAVRADTHGRCKQRLRASVLQNGRLSRHQIHKSNGTDDAAAADDDDDYDSHFLLLLDAYRILHALTGGHSWLPEVPPPEAAEDSVAYETAMMVNHIMVEINENHWDPMRAIKHLVLKARREGRAKDPAVSAAVAFLHSIITTTHRHDGGDEAQQDKGYVNPPRPLALLSDRANNVTTTTTTNDENEALLPWALHQDWDVGSSSVMDRKEITVRSGPGSMDEVRFPDPDYAMEMVRRRYGYMLLVEEEEGEQDEKRTPVRRWVSSQVDRLFGEDLDPIDFRLRLRSAAEERLYRNPFLRMATSRASTMLSTVLDWFEYRLFGPDPFVIDGVRSVVEPGTERYAGDGPYTLYPAPPDWIPKDDRGRRTRFYRYDGGGDQTAMANHGYAIHMEALENNPYYAGMYKVALQLSYANQHNNNNNNNNTDQGIPDDVLAAMQSHDGDGRWYFGRMLAASRQVIYAFGLALNEVSWNSDSYAFHFPTVGQIRDLFSQVHLPSFLDDMIAAMSGTIGVYGRRLQAERVAAARRADNTAWARVDEYLDSFDDMPPKPRTPLEERQRLVEEIDVSDAGRDERYSGLVQADLALRTLVARVLVPHRIDAILDEMATRSPTYAHYVARTRERVAFERSYADERLARLRQALRSSSSLSQEDEYIDDDDEGETPWRASDEEEEGGEEDPYATRPDWDETDEHGKEWDATAWALLGWRGGVTLAVDHLTAEEGSGAAPEDDPSWNADDELDADEADDRRRRRRMRTAVTGLDRTHHPDPDSGKHLKEGDKVWFADGYRGVFLGLTGSPNTAGVYPSSMRFLSDGLASMAATTIRGLDNQGLVQRTFIVAVGKGVLVVIQYIMKYWKLIATALVAIITSPWGVFVIENEVLFFWRNVVGPLYSEGLLKIFASPSDFLDLVLEFILLQDAIGMFFVTETTRYVLCFIWPITLTLLVIIMIPLVCLTGGLLGFLLGIPITVVILISFMFPYCPPEQVVDGKLKQTIFMYLQDILDCFGRDLPPPVGKDAYDLECVRADDCPGAAPCRCLDKGGQYNSVWISFIDNTDCGTDASPTGGCLCWPKLACEFTFPRIGDDNPFDTKCDVDFGYNLDDVAYFDQTNPWKMARATIGNMWIWTKFVTRAFSDRPQIHPAAFTILMAFSFLILIYGGWQIGGAIMAVTIGFQYGTRLWNDAILQWIIPGLETTNDQGWWPFNWFSEIILSFIQFDNHSAADPVGSFSASEFICWFFNSSTAAGGASFSFFWWAFWFILIWYALGTLVPYLWYIFTLPLRPARSLYRYSLRQGQRTKMFKMTQRYLDEHTPQRLKNGARQNAKRIAAAYRVFAPLVRDDLAALYRTVTGRREQQQQQQQPLLQYYQPVYLVPHGYEIRSRRGGRARVHPQYGVRRGGGGQQQFARGWHAVPPSVVTNANLRHRQFSRQRRRRGRHDKHV